MKSVSKETILTACRRLKPGAALILSAALLAEVYGGIVAAMAALRADLTDQGGFAYMIGVKLDFGLTITRLPRTP